MMHNQQIKPLITCGPQTEKPRLLWCFIKYIIHNVVPEKAKFLCCSRVRCPSGFDIRPSDIFFFFTWIRLYSWTQSILFCWWCHPLWNLLWAPPLGFICAPVFKNKQKTKHLLLLGLLNVSIDGSDLCMWLTLLMWNFPTRQTVWVLENFVSLLWSPAVHLQYIGNLRLDCKRIKCNWGFRPVKHLFCLPVSLLYNEVSVTCD